MCWKAIGQWNGHRVLQRSLINKSISGRDSRRRSISYQEARIRSVVTLTGLNIRQSRSLKPCNRCLRFRTSERWESTSPKLSNVDATVLTVLFLFQIVTTNPFFQSWGIVADCHTVVKTACNLWIMDLPPVFSSSAHAITNSRWLSATRHCHSFSASSRKGGLSSMVWSAPFTCNPPTGSCTLGGSTMDNCSAKRAL